VLPSEETEENYEGVSVNVMLLYLFLVSEPTGLMKAVSCCMYGFDGLRSDGTGYKNMCVMCHKYKCAGL